MALLLDAGADPDVACHAREDTYRSGNWSRQTAGGKEALESADRAALHMAVEAGSAELVETDMPSPFARGHRPKRPPGASWGPGRAYAPWSAA